MQRPTLGLLFLKTAATVKAHPGLPIVKRSPVPQTRGGDILSRRQQMKAREAVRAAKHEQWKQEMAPLIEGERQAAANSAQARQSIAQARGNISTGGDQWGRPAGTAQANVANPDRPRQTYMDWLAEQNKNRGPDGKTPWERFTGAKVPSYSPAVHAAHNVDRIREFERRGANAGTREQRTSAVQKLVEGSPDIQKDPVYNKALGRLRAADVGKWQQANASQRLRPRVSRASPTPSIWDSTKRVLGAGAQAARFLPSNVAPFAGVMGSTYAALPENTRRSIVDLPNRFAGAVQAAQTSLAKPKTKT